MTANRTKAQDYVGPDGWIDQPFDDEIHDGDCDLRLTMGRTGPCTCTGGPWVRKPMTSELPPIVATVQAGDALIFLAPTMGEWGIEETQHHYGRLKRILGDTPFTFAPAVGVVIKTAPPLQMVDIPGYSARCTAILGHPNMAGFRLCNLAPGHPSHEHEDFQGKWLQPPED